MDDETFKKLERILEDADSITDVNMTMSYKKTVKLCLLAESRLKKLISAISMVRQLRIQPAALKKKKEDKKEEAPAGAAAKKKQGDANKPKKDDTTEYLPLPDKLKSMTKEQGDALSKKCYVRNVCKNCGGCDSRFPGHKSFQCPHQCRWAAAWPDGHVAVQMASATGETIMNPVIPTPEEPKPVRQTHGCTDF